jgi:hypothetical protein
MRPRSVGYAKLGRSMPLSIKRCGSNGGDVEMVPTLQILAERHPDVEFVIVGRNTGEDPADVDLPANVVNPWRQFDWRRKIRKAMNDMDLNHPNLSIREHLKLAEILHAITGPQIFDLDGIVMWVGQHGTSNMPLPSIKDRNVFTKPYDWATLYGSYLLRGINTWRDVDPHNREEVLLNADPRNVPKYRDGRYPWQHPVLSQYDQVNGIKHEEGDRVVQSKVRSVYSRLEISGLLPGTPFGDMVKFDYNHVDRPYDFGIVFNETARDVSLHKTRRYILKEWILPLSPGFIYGKWSAQTQRELDIEIEPVDVTEYFNLIQTARCTLTTPSSGSGWATAKPWECFAAGVVCFFHPAYDDQNHILSDAPEWLRDWLRVDGPQELRDRIRAMRDMPKFWLEVVAAQRDHFDNTVLEPRYLQMIEERLGLWTP